MTQPSQSDHAAPNISKGRRAAEWTLAGLVALGMLFPTGAVPKLTGDPFSIDLFNTIAPSGFADAARFGAGLHELLAAGLVLIPLTRVYGALLAAAAMVGAVAAHLLTPLGMFPTLTNADTGEQVQTPIFVFALALLAASAALVWLRRRDLPLKALGSP